MTRIDATTHTTASTTGNVGAKLLTVNLFRRRFFDVQARPSKADVIRWITRGTSEGAVLKAHSIDGVMYINADDAAKFIADSQTVARTDKPKGLPRKRTSDALDALRKFGVKV